MFPQYFVKENKMLCIQNQNELQRKFSFHILDPMSFSFSDQFKFTTLSKIGGCSDVAPVPELTGRLRK